MFDVGQVLSSLQRQMYFGQRYPSAHGGVGMWMGQVMKALVTALTVPNNMYLFIYLLTDLL